ncbi:hypothetical protein C343_01687 [Cryptococcus neoformans C23]|uniref:Uncharacterized protein n=1 Tax=Cryptococcus neoformans (strain H99 / ATCC 208821 / CBS 10515 / FGSC 9487) TaxID=235443 RepID=J9VHB4_CRYN9|nr:hypothetical protein CNAG_02894 [Cryptococcus neoformans var. grubii H99]AUB23373.1 hypothetical protein CKF44_02894 [Cryptococcus neoformans var. grubii]OWZ34372.1 hypothetical protein C347_01756 [Cryptococcus neoformans var. grubii AD2-60a]OWZ46456.1 hypothetical protein C343_01687 [Cryptococcus neoformans var. grubii C23]OXG34796.1 hypothetical protein C359_06253 [Cryptococcus neoformans var. grubii Bt120]OXG37967.1 hypothetical protein C360_01724 [Cryptococcus neoformans var. grubii Bt1|eukprot:XP_012047858.1 hypothetical protein CNAG_02894 [Cryptococcus neoformans var. grubii H99]
MASRLASLTPSKNARSRGSPSPSPSPAQSPLRPTETTHHRMLKLVIGEIKNVIRNWDEIVILEGFKAAKGCVDESTEMDNILDVEERPEREEVGPHLSTLYNHRVNLQTTISKLDNFLGKLNQLVDQAEKVLLGACQRETYDFVFIEPLWLTWTLEHFVNTISSLIPHHTYHLAELSVLASTILDPATAFDDAKYALEAWRDLATGGERWEAVREWEELVEMELTKAEEEEEEEDNAKGRKKRR